MRIAVTGAHGTGKTTLIEDFLDVQRHYEHVQEPYLELPQNGLPFADGPSAPDLLDQLEQSAQLILATIPTSDVIFDRSPLDYIAYLEIVSEREGIDWSPPGKLLAKIEKALASLDLIVLVPLTVPDEITTEIEYPKLRRAVNARLQSIVLEDTLGLLADGPPTIEISGTRRDRVEKLIHAQSAEVRQATKP
jgi:GTPase SAR1 family protein